MDNQDVQISVDTNMSIELTAGEWSHLLRALDDMPRRVAQPIHEKINGFMVEFANARKPKQNGLSESPKSLEKVV